MNQVEHLGITKAIDVLPGLCFGNDLLVLNLEYKEALTT